MGTKNKITEENYKEVVLKRSIIICWVLLAICLVIKLFGGNFFGIVCTNEKFVKFCEYCDTSFIRYIIYFIIFMFESIFLILTISPSMKLGNKRFIFYCISCIAFWIVKVLYEFGKIQISSTLANIIPIVVLYLLLAVFSKRPFMSVIIIIYQTALSVISSLIKNIGFGTTLTNSFLVASIFAIDYYILIVLTLLYSKKIYKKKGE